MYVTCEVYFIKPTGDYLCSTQPCLTLNEFIVKPHRNLSMHTSLRLLPGNHSLNLDLQIQFLENISIFSQTNLSWIVCDQPREFQFLNVTTVRIRNLGFMGCGGNKVAYVSSFRVENCIFHRSHIVGTSAVVHAGLSSVEIRHCSFINIYNGIIILALQSKVSNRYSIFHNNTATILISAKNTAIFDKCIFTHNKAAPSAFIIANTSTIMILGSFWANNTFEKQPSEEYIAMIYSAGSILVVEGSTFAHTRETGGVLMAVSSAIFFHNSNFTHNSALLYMCFSTYSNVSIRNTTIAHNVINNGYVIAIVDSKIIDLQGLTFTKNRGGIKILRSKANFTNGIVFSDNNGSLTAINSFVTFYSNISFMKCRQNSTAEKGGIVTSEQSTLHFYGTTSFTDHYSKVGGAIYAADSRIHMHGRAVIANNMAEASGGGIFLYKSELNCYINCTFYKNHATIKGGGVHAFTSTIIAEVEILEEYQQRYLLFSENSAGMGGAVYLESSSKLRLLNYGLFSQYNVTLLDNTADYGGAVYVNDSSSPICGSKFYATHSTQTECFLQAFTDRKGTEKYLINFVRNSANVAGSTLFGGLLDRCTVNSAYTDDFSDLFGNKQSKHINGLSYLKALSNILPAEIASHPVRVCYCSDHRPNCTHDLQSVTLQRGEKISLSLVIVDQVNHTINGTIHSVATATKDPDVVKQSHDVFNVCTNLTFNVFLHSKQLALFAIGPCNNTGISERIVQIQFSECICPIGFWPSDNEDACECICDPKLPKFIKTCILKTESIVREDNIWIDYINSTAYNGHGGYLIYPNCPFDYCRPSTPAVSINLNVPHGADSQCAFNRTGLLCGRCKPGFSLSLGGSLCLVCPKTWPGLLTANLIAQLFTGIIIVGLVVTLNLTVAAGTFNGLLFYAHIVAANRSNLLPFRKPNILTIFIACLNLEFGIERCYFKGMDAYSKTWVQLLFPTYIIALVYLVIIISRHSSVFVKLIRKGNPVATLATLILLSYAKILRTIIDILSFAILNYPDGSREVVWLPDASVKYLQGKHVLLFLTAIIIIIIGIPYTVLLFSWQWLLRAPHNKVLKWIRNTKLNSFMDAYLAPHTKLSPLDWSASFCTSNTLSLISSEREWRSKFSSSCHWCSSSFFAFITVVFKKQDLQE